MGLLSILALSVIVPHAPMAHTHAGVWMSGSEVWEETPVVQKMTPKEYHPSLRFNPSSTYMFASPDFVQQGKYQVQNGHYFFRAIMANELENADISMLRTDMPPNAGQKMAEAYARSMSNFEGDYDDSTGALTISYTVEGRLKSFELYPYTAGDRDLANTLADAERGFGGVWHAPEPYPDKLDARTRYKIGDLEGLQRFAKEASESDRAQFGLIDLRTDNSFRSHGTIGTWHSNGSVVWLTEEGKTTELAVSSNHQKLLAGGKALYVRD